MFATGSRKVWAAAVGVAVAAGAGVWVWHDATGGEVCAGAQCPTRGAGDRQATEQVDLGELPGYGTGHVVVGEDGQPVGGGADPADTSAPPTPDPEPTPGAVLTANPGPLGDGLATWTRPDGSYLVVDTTTDLPAQVVDHANARARQALAAPSAADRAAALEDLYRDVAALRHDVVLVATNPDGVPEVTTAWVDHAGNLYIDIFTALGQDKAAEVDQRLRAALTERGGGALVLDLR